MDARENQMRAAELFEYARHELTRLLQNAPEFGSVTLELAVVGQRLGDGERALELDDPISHWCSPSSV